MKTYTQMKSIQDFNKKALLGALLAAGMVMGSGSAGAATETGTLTVTANVVAACTIGDATLAFGPYDPNGAAVDAQTTVAVNCTNGSPFEVYSSHTVRFENNDYRLGWSRPSAHVSIVCISYQPDIQY